MSVIDTDKWLLKYYHDPVKLCEKLVTFFNGATVEEIYQYLMINGMYQRPLKKGKELVDNLHENKVWALIKWEEKNLRRIWGGPNIPIFILPSDSTNRRMQTESNGKSGLAFHDKLFLFITEDNSKNELRALFTHEYNHICRLSSYPKKEKDYVLLDTIILEGLAENAVRERLGIDYTAAWTTYYSDKELEDFWENIILPNKEVPKFNRNHSTLLYGTKLYPKMVGYSVGYYLVKSYLTKNDLTTKDILEKSPSEIAQLS